MIDLESDPPPPSADASAIATDATPEPAAPPSPAAHAAPAAKSSLAKTGLLYIGVVGVSIAVGVASARFFPPHATMTEAAPAAAAPAGEHAEEKAEPTEKPEKTANAEKTEALEKTPHAETKEKAETADAPKEAADAEAPVAHEAVDAAAPEKAETAATEEHAEAKTETAERSGKTETAEKTAAPEKPAELSGAAALVDIAILHAHLVATNEAKHAHPPHESSPAEPVEEPAPARHRRHAHASAARPAKPEECEVMADFAERAAAVHELSAAQTLYRSVLACNPRYTPALIGNADAVWTSGDKTTASLLYRAIVDNFPDHLYPARVAVRAAPTVADE